MLKLPSDQVRHLRLRAQYLHRPDNRPGLSVGQLMAEVFALQAQDEVAAFRSLWVRSSLGLQETDIAQTIAEERSVVRTWCMRGTLHLLPAAELGWLLPLFGPRFIRQTRRRYQQLGLTADHFRRANRLLPQLLNEAGPLTRPELAERLAQENIPTEGQAMPHLLRRAALEGVICFGPGRDGEETYVSLESWLDVSAPIAEKEALARLARRYLRAFGPASPADMAAWSGLTKTQSRTGFNEIAEELLELSSEDGSLRLLREQADWLNEPAGEQPIVRLLPAYDAFLLSYQHRHLIVPAPYAKRVHPGGGLIRATVLVNGQVAGTWKATRRRDRLMLTIEPFADLNDDIKQMILESGQDLARFHNLETAEVTFN